MNDNYEYDERAAIRLFNGNFDEIEANQLALIDIQKRKKQSDVMSKPKFRPPELSGMQACEIERLRKKAKAIRIEMKWLEDGPEMDGLFEQWLELQNRIIEIKKGKDSDYDNGKRLSG